MSEQIRQMAEMRDTCVQYAAWVRRDFQSTSPEFKKAQLLYIQASSAANSYIEALQFDLLATGDSSPEKYVKAAERVHSCSKEFLDYAQEIVGVKKARFLPLLIPLAGSLVDLGVKLNGISQAANAQQRDIIARSLGEKKWKPFNEITP